MEGWVIHKKQTFFFSFILNMKIDYLNYTILPVKPKF